MPDRFRHQYGGLAQSRVVDMYVAVRRRRPLVSEQPPARRQPVADDTGARIAVRPAYRNGYDFFRSIATSHLGMVNPSELTQPPRCGNAGLQENDSPRNATDLYSSSRGQFHVDEIAVWTAAFCTATERFRTVLKSSSQLSKQILPKQQRPFAPLWAGCDV